MPPTTPPPDFDAFRRAVYEAWENREDHVEEIITSPSTAAALYGVTVEELFAMCEPPDDE